MRGRLDARRTLKSLVADLRFNNPTDLKRHLCDIANAGYCISNEELINEIKLKLP
jgi:hypothetical protein